jgi:hypothetical protein
VADDGVDVARDRHADGDGVDVLERAGHLDAETLSVGVRPKSRGALLNTPLPWWAIGAACPTVRRWFGFTDDLDNIATWVGESCIRWGFDRQSRAPHRLDEFVHNTWRFGLDRILTGVAMSDDSRAGTAMRLADVRSQLGGRPSRQPRTRRGGYWADA